MLDVDLKRFAELKKTGDGLKLLMAMHEMRCAIYQIERLEAFSAIRGRTRDQVDTWRRAYIRASDHASQAIDRLWNSHQWPTDAGRDRSFDWRPRR